MEEAFDTERNARKLPPLLSWEEVGGLLKKAMFLKNWAENLEKVSLNHLVSGGEIPGWKIVEGRSNRKLSDADAALGELIKAGYEEAVLYNREPIALGELEKVCSKEDKQNILSKYIIKPQGKPTLAPADDKRKAMEIQRVSVSEAFGGENSYKEET